MWYEKATANDFNYGVRQVGNTHKKNVSSNSQKRFTFQISKPTVEHNLDDIASNDRKWHQNASWNYIF